MSWRFASVEMNTGDNVTGGNAPVTAFNKQCEQISYANFFTFFSSPLEGKAGR